VTDRQLICGPFHGHLSNEGESVQLWKAFRAGWDLVFEESVQYTNRAPWPKEANGTGLSLQRVVPSAYANEPLNWKADIPTPALANLPGPATRDTDGDGMPDVWEWVHGLDLWDPADAARDDDGDGMTNLQEYLSGTDPKDPASCLRLTTIQRGPDLALRFTDTTATTFALQYRNRLTDGNWGTLTNFVGTGSGQTIEIHDGPSKNLPSRFYRLRLNP